MPRIPAQLLADPAWRVLDVIGNGTFPTDDRLWGHINFRRGSVDFEAILGEESWSSGERCY